MGSVVCIPCRHRLGSDHTGIDGPLLCPHCNQPMTCDMVAVPQVPGFVYFDHTFTPSEAQAILETIPADSNHWTDIPRKAAGAVPRYTALMLTGEWRDETLERGFYEHPIRWNENGEITHGVMRLLASATSGKSFRACVLCPTWFAGELGHDAG